jgi:hypothetical protein
MVIDGDRSLLLELVERAEERRAGRLVAQGAEDVLPLEDLGEIGKGRLQVVYDGVARAHRLGDRRRGGLDLRPGRLGSGGGPLAVERLLPKPVESSDPGLVGRVQQGDVGAKLLLERVPALLVFLPCHGFLLEQAYGSGSPAVEPSPRRRESLPCDRASVPDGPAEVPGEREASPDVPEGSPDNGKSFPDDGESSPVNGETSPDVPEGSPDVPEGLPDDGEGSPDVPERHPDVPEESPDVPESLPDVPQRAPDVPEAFRMFRQTLRTFRKLFRTFRKAVRTVRKVLRIVRRGLPGTRKALPIVRMVIRVPAKGSG